MRRHAVPVSIALLVVSALFAACGDGGSGPSRIVAGSRDLGKEAIRHYGCGSCHTIPGVKGANALVGPPLIPFGKRSYIAGQLSNTPENLARWIQDPRGVEPGTARPDLGVTPEEARNIAAYLEGLN